MQLPFLIPKFFFVENENFTNLSKTAQSIT